MHTGLKPLSHVDTSVADQCAQAGATGESQD